MPPEVLKGHGSNETSIKRAEGESSLIISSVSSLRVYLNSIPAGRCPILSNAGISFPPSFTFVRFFARRSTTGLEQRNRSDSRRHPACRPLTEEKFSQLSSTNKVVCQRPSSTHTSPIDTFTLPLSHSPLSLSPLARRGVPSTSTVVSRRASKRLHAAFHAADKSTLASISIAAFFAAYPANVAWVVPDVIRSSPRDSSSARMTGARKARGRKGTKVGEKRERRGKTLGPSRSRVAD